MAKGKRLSKKALNTIFLKGLDDHVVWNSDASSSPLLVDLQPRPDQIRTEFQAPLPDEQGNLSISQANDTQVWENLMQCLEAHLQLRGAQ